MMKRLLLLLFVSMQLLSCGTSNFIKTGFDDSNQMPALLEDAKVSIISQLPKNAKRIVEIGICKGSVPGGGMFADYTHKAIKKIKECARENGGNTILLDKNSDDGSFTALGYSQEIAKAQGRIYYIEF